MAESITARGKRARQILIETAADLVRERGIKATTIDEVLAACDMGKSQFYHYFSGKDQLMVDVIHYRTETQVRELYFEPLANVETLAGLCRWLREFSDLIVNTNYIYGCPVGTLSMQLDQSEQILRGEINSVLDQVYNSLHDALERVRERGQLAKRTNTVELATHLLGVMQGGLLLSRSFRDPDKLRSVLRQAEKQLQQLRV